jgi:hypothetical protein
VSGLLQKADIGERHHTPPSSITKENKGTCLGIELTANTTHLKY